MLTKRIKPGQLFTASGKVFRVRKTNLKSRDECAECRIANGGSDCMADNFLCITVCGYGHYPQFICNTK